MKYSLLLGLTLCSAVVLTGCKSKDSAYRQAYERAKAQPTTPVEPTTPVATTPETNVVVTPVTPVTPSTPDPEVRTIPGGVTLVSGEPLKAYSVVVGSFVSETNAQGLSSTLKGKGYSARVVKTGETINGHTGWYRVIASSFDDKSAAVQSREELKGNYSGAWLLYNK